MSSASSTPRLRSRAGFTLIELVIALFLAALVAGIIFQMVRGQTTFVALATARQETVQNAQGALEIIGSDLRGVPNRGVLDAGRNHVGVAVPRAWGISCGGGSATSLSMLVPASLPATALDVNGGGARGIFVQDAAGAWTPATTAPVAAVTAIATFDPTVAGNACAALNAGTLVTGVTLTGSNFPAAPEGSSVVLYGLARYDVGTTSGSTTPWVQRSATMTGTSAYQMQPLAGPLPASDALRFEYLDANGNDLGVPGTNGPNAGISRVKIVVNTTTTNPMVDASAEVERDSVIVSLRNQ